MIRTAVFLAVLMLASCAQRVAVPAEGPILKGEPDQAREQCEAQPLSAWCHK